METLDLRRGGFSPPLSLLMAAFSLPDAPPILTVELRCDWNALLPILKGYWSFGTMLEPRYIFGAETLDQ